MTECVWKTDDGKIVCVVCGRPSRFVSRRICSRGAAGGPGTELRKLLAELGLTEKPGCNCLVRASQMDAWGVAGCRLQRIVIIGWLEEAERETGWGEWAAAGRKAAMLGILSVGALADEAIRRAATAESPPSAQTR